MKNLAHNILRFVSIACLCVTTVPSLADEPITHSFFIAGPSFTGIIAEDGSEEWNAGKAGARDGFILPNGNALIAWGNEVKELTREKEVIFHYTKSADNNEIGTAQRLENGHTLVNLTHGNKSVEMDADGKVIWKISNDDFPDLKPFADPCGAQRLPNGNTVIASYASKEAIKVFEVTPEKKIVWTYQGPHRAHEIQILTTNGKPIEGLPLK